MPKKLYTEKQKEAIDAANEAFSWLMELKEFKPIWQKAIDGKVSKKEEKKIKSIFGFCPRADDHGFFPFLALIGCIETLSEVPYNQDSVIEENYYHCYGRTKDGFLVSPNSGITKIPVGLPPQRITLLIHWNYPIRDILNKIEDIIKHIQFLHEIKPKRPRKKEFITRINKKLLFKNKHHPPEAISVEISVPFEEITVRR